MAYLANIWRDAADGTLTVAGVGVLRGAGHRQEPVGAGSRRHDAGVRRRGPRALRIAVPCRRRPAPGAQAPGAPVRYHPLVRSPERLRLLNTELGAQTWTRRPLCRCWRRCWESRPDAGYEPAAAEGHRLQEQIIDAMRDYLLACVRGGPADWWSPRTCTGSIPQPRTSCGHFSMPRRTRRDDPHDFTPVVIAPGQRERQSVRVGSAVRQ